MLQKTVKINYIDTARSIAILAVVICHTVGSIYFYPLHSKLSISNNLMKLSVIDKLSAFLILTIGRLGVPLFLMITGVLLLDRDYSPIVTLKKHYTKLLKLIFCTQLWIIFYNLFQYAFLAKNFSFINLVRQLLFLEQLPFNHTWYMPVIIGLYIFLPLIANGINKLSIWYTIIMLIPVILNVFVLPIVNKVFQINLSTIIDIRFIGDTYGIYIIVGWLMKKIKRISTSLLFGIFSVSLILSLVIQMKLLQDNKLYLVWYNDIFILLMAISLFLFIKQQRFSADFTKTIAIYSFGIYLIHNPILELLNRVVPQTGILFFDFIVLTIMTLGLSLVCLKIIHKIPYISKIILYL